MMKYIAIIILILVITNVIQFLLLKSKNKKYNDLKFHYDEIKSIHSATITTENKKTEIREKYNEKESEILNNNDIITDGVMPINKTVHTGSFKDRKNNTVGN